MEKIKKYAPLAANEGLPLLICVYLHFESWLKAHDLYKGLYGLSGEFIGDFEFKEYSSGAKFHDVSTGIFYSSDQTKKNVSGVLLRYREQHEYFHNHFH